jgi:hypothetical protein
MTTAPFSPQLIKGGLVLIDAETAGTRLRDAIQAVQTPPLPAPDASQIERDLAPQARLAEVVGAVAKLKFESDCVSARCREVPVASFDFGVQGPLTTPDTGAHSRPRASSAARCACTSEQSGRT